jgi:hypothetical protein
VGLSVRGGEALRGLRRCAGGGRPCASVSPQGQAQGPQGRRQANGLAGVARCERSERLGENATRTVGIDAGKLADGNNELDGGVSPGEVGEVALIVAPYAC